MARNTEGGADNADYLLKKIPGDIWDAAKAKAAAQRPALSMRWVLIKLLEKWVEGSPAAAPKPKAAPKAARAPRVPKTPTPPAGAPSIEGGVPDLSNIF